MHAIRLIASHTFAVSIAMALVSLPCGTAAFAFEATEGFPNQADTSATATESVDTNDEIQLTTADETKTEYIEDDGDSEVESTNVVDKGGDTPEAVQHDAAIEAVDEGTTDRSDTQEDPDVQGDDLSSNQLALKDTYSTEGFAARESSPSSGDAGGAANAQVSATTNLSDGFYVEGNSTYYRKKGKKATNSFVVVGQAGATSEHPAGTYYFGADGKMVTGEKALNGAWYYFDSASGGRMTQDADMYVTSSGGKWVYYAADGKMAKGEVSRNGGTKAGWYYYDDVTGASIRGWKYLSKGNKWVFYDPDNGCMWHGEGYVSRNSAKASDPIPGWCYFDDVTGATKYGWKLVTSNGGKWVYYDPYTGRMWHGEGYVSRDSASRADPIPGWCYFDNVTGATQYGFAWVAKPGKWVHYHLQTGRMQHGSFTVGGVKYTADVHTGAIPKSQWSSHWGKVALNGYDISSHNAGINLSQVAGDFVIVKATEGTTYLNPYFSGWADQTIALGRKLGIYHFVNANSSMEDQARYFVNAAKDYVGNAVLVLDWEDTRYSSVLNKGPDVAKQFLDYVYKSTGVKPFIYMSKSTTNSYDWSKVSSAGYKLWVAEYLSAYENDRNTVGYVSDPESSKSKCGSWGEPTMYQYESTGKLKGYNGSTLDLNVFYGSTNDWDKLAEK